MSGASAPARSTWTRALLLQLVVTCLAATAINATKPTMTYRSLSLGATPLDIGLIQSSFSILPALTAVAIGRWIDRVGESRYLMVSLIFIATGSVIAALAPALLVLALAQVCLGFGQIVYLVSSQSLVANHGSREGREERYGHYATATSVGQLAGPALAAAIIGGSAAVVAVNASGLLASTGPMPVAATSVSAAGLLPDAREVGVFLAAAALTATAACVAFLIPGYSRRASAAAAGGAGQPGIRAMTAQVLRRPGMLPAMVVSLVVTSAIDVLIAYLPAYGEDVGLSVALVGTLLSVRAAASLVSRFFMARTIKRLGRARLLGLSMLLPGFGFLLMPFETAPVVLILIMVAVGLGLGLGQPMTIAWVANRSPRSERATAIGVRITGNRVALLVVPTAMGAIAGSAGITAIFIVLAAMLIVGAVVALTAPLDDDSVLAEAPTTTPVTATDASGSPVGAPTDTTS